MNPAIPILLYHSVSDTPTGKFGPYTVSRRQFADHLDRVLDRGYTVLTIGELLQRRDAGRPLPERTVAVTFDDGFGDFADNAWPELSARGLNATLYVTTDTIDGTSQWLAPLAAADMPMLSTGQLRELAAAGCELGAHSMSHPQLDTLPLSWAEREIRESREELEQVLQQPVTHFAYPHGYHSRDVKRLVAASGYTSAAAVRNALSHDGDDRLALARVTIGGDFGIADLDDVLDGRGIARAVPRESLKTRVWRMARRRMHQTPVAATV